jgi:hypothetical protein
MADEASRATAAASRWDTNLEGYRMVAELLTSMRRIVGRAADRLAGPSDEAGAWPDDVKTLLIERRDAERDVPRSGSVDDEFDDLMAFATFGDLARRVRSNAELTRLVGKIGDHPGDLLERLDELESIREVVAEARLLTDEQIASLRSHHEVVAAILSGTRRRVSEAQSPAAQDVPEPVPGTAAEPADPSADLAAEELVDEVGESDEIFDDDDGLGADFAAVDESQVRSAIEAEQDTRVLSMLHAEIMALAEDVFAGRRGRPRPAWHAICDSGWYASRRDPRGLDILEAFHSTIDAWDEAGDAGADAERLRSILRERGFSGLLLSLREMFDRNRF